MYRVVYDLVMRKCAQYTLHCAAYGMPYTTAFKQHLHDRNDGDDEKEAEKNAVALL